MSERLTAENDAARWLAVQEAANEARRKHPAWRFGQALFNVLWEMDRPLADQIRGTAADPFHDERHIPAFAQAVMTRVIPPGVTSDPTTEVDR